MVYVKVTPEAIAYGGAPSLNLSKLLSKDAIASANNVATVEAFRVLSDTTAVSPLLASTKNCTAAVDQCFSFVFPGNVLDLFVEIDTSSTVTQTKRLVLYKDTPVQASKYVLVNASAYQLEYYPLQEKVEFNFATDCTITVRFPLVSYPLQLCLKEIDGDIAACNLFHLVPS